MEVKVLCVEEGVVIYFVVVEYLVVWYGLWGVGLVGFVLFVIE